MCECASEIEQKLKSHLEENSHFKKPIKSVTLQGKTLSISDNTLGSCVVSNFDIELEGQKKIVVMPVKQSFCPFCGDSSNPAEDESK
jgi:hypothetical protein